MTFEVDLIWVGSTGPAALEEFLSKYQYRQ